MSHQTVVLVHGAWAGSWAWGFVAAELENRDVPHTAVDLPSRGPGPGTLPDDSAAVRAAVAAAGGPVVLCGHSYGGMVITEAAADREDVAHLVYVCATMPEAGESMASLMAGDPVPSAITASLRMADDGTATLDPDGARAIIFNDATDEQSAMVLGALGSHRMGTFGEAAAAVGWRDRSSTYVVCTRDLVLSETLQRRMARRATTTVTLEAGHAPMLTRAAELADVLAGIARGGRESAPAARPGTAATG
jgi:pimeloyl-ACP methyl ester carboxylesterase